MYVPENTWHTVLNSFWYSFSGSQMMYITPMWPILLTYYLPLKTYMVLRGEWKRVTVEKQPQVIGWETQCGALRKSVWLDSAMQSWGYPGDTGGPPRSCSHPGPTAHSIHTEPPQQTSHYQPIQELQVSQTHNCFKTVDKGNSSRKTIFCNNISLFFLLPFVQKM